MSAPVHVNSLDVSQISFQVGKAQKDRMPSIAIRYKNAPLQLRLPRLAFPFGLRENANDSGEKSYTLSAVLKGCDPYCVEEYNGTDEIGNMYNAFRSIQNEILKQAEKQTIPWFKKKRSMESIRDTYNSILRPSKENRDGEMVANGKYPPTFRIKVPVYDGRVSAEFVTAARENIYVTPDSLVSLLPKGVEANLVITGSIYILAGGTFGVSWRLKAAQIFPPEVSSATDMFSDETSSRPTKAIANVEDESEEYGGGVVNDESVKEEALVEEIKPSAGAGGPAPPAPTVRKRRAVASSAPL